MENAKIIEGMKRIGSFGVDSGLCWIGDPCHILPYDRDTNFLPSRTWTEFCDLIFGKDFMEFKAGVVCSTNGDGEYPVYAKVEDGKVKGIFIDFE